MTPILKAAKTVKCSNSTGEEILALMASMRNDLPVPPTPLKHLQWLKLCACTTAHACHVLVGVRVDLKLNERSVLNQHSAYLDNHQG